MASKKYKKLGVITKKQQTHRCREQTSGYHWGEKWGKGQHGGKGLRGTKLLCIKYATRIYCTTWGI